MVCNLMLAWNLRIQMRLGLSGFCMLVTKVLRLEEGLQTKDHRMAMLHHADLYVQMRGIAGKIKEVKSGVFKTPIQFQQYHGIQNHKVCCTQTLHGTLKLKYFHKTLVFFLKLQKILCIQTGS